MKIGYQGLVGSNSEASAHKFAKEMELHHMEFIPLLSSKNVVAALLAEDIDYGVMAVKNTIGGRVEETKLAIAGKKIQLVYENVLPIHHTLFYQSEAVKKEEIRFIASHVQALKQSSQHLSTHYPGVTLLDVGDTAIAAKQLAGAVLSADTAIIARKNAGERHGLYMVADKIENTDDNKTTFHLYKKG